MGFVFATALIYSLLTLLCFVIPKSSAGKPYFSGKFVALDDNGKSYPIQEEFYTLMFSELVNGAFKNIPSRMNIGTRNLDEFSYVLNTRELPKVLYVHIYRASCIYKGDNYFMNESYTETLQKQLIKTVPTEKKSNVVLDVANTNLDIYVHIKLLNQDNTLTTKEQYTPFKFQVMTVDLNDYVQEVNSYWEEGKNLGWTVKVRRGYYNPIMLHVSQGGQPLIEKGITDDCLAVPQFREGQSEYVDYFLLIQLANPLKLTDAKKQELKKDSLQKGMSTFANIRQNDFKQLFKGIKQQIRSRKGQ